MTSRDLETGLALVRKDFNLDSSELGLEGQELTKEKFIQKLSSLVAYLMEKDFSRLLQILYRIDISEEQLKAALTPGQVMPSDLIAQMIFDREMQKVETRKRFSE